MKTVEQKTKRVPAIRFAGFDDEWVEKKLGDETIELIAGGDIDKAKVVKKGKYPIYANALTHDGVVGYYDDFFRVKAPAVTITGRGEVGHAKARKENFTPVVRLLSVRSNHDSVFLENAINLHNVVVESTGVPQLTVPQVSAYEIFFPCKLDEEEKLGFFFSNIDSLISLEQKKYDKLTQVKKSMLEKMFPKEGAAVPEIRFAGFTGDWNVQKASKICSITTGKSNTQDQVDGGLYPFFIRSDEPVRSNRYLYDEEAVITIGDGNIGKVFHYVNGKFDLHQRCYKMSDFKDVLGKYFYYFFSTKFYQRAIKMTAKATVDSVRLEMISEMDIQYPENLKEQQKIGSYFSHLDSLISLQQRKLDKLKNIKKSLLEKMFV